ncbi:tRNA cyclic N6-threonylcarbamoyladenosine(37) synthase TcdA [Vreelandella rituensis]|nr:tRNA cyclic N6-threonylcarbamoyladenosine(37) synthase TcdA [Halomonas rituensis]
MSDVNSDDYAFRFGGIRRLYGARAFEHFRHAHVVVVGVGGVGSWTVEALARSGIGKLTLIDLDDVCVSNINRQLHALDGTFGRPKVEVLAERCRLIQPGIDVVADTAFVTPTNLAERIPENADHVVDAIDSVIAKAALIAWCKRRKLPITVTGAAGGQTDPTRIRIADLTRTEHDPLLAKVRSRLRRDYGFSRNPKRRFSVECVYSDEQLIYPGSEGEVCLQKPGTGEVTRLDCAEGFGAATFLTGSFGFTAASRVLARLAQKAQALSPLESQESSPSTTSPLRDEACDNKPG